MKFTNKKKYKKFNKYRSSKRKRKNNKSFLLKKKNKKLRIKSYKKMRGGRGLVGNGLLDQPFKLAAHNILDTFSMDNINTRPVGSERTTYSNIIS